MPFVYMLQCRDHSFYTGWTTDLERRIQAHQDGKGARYTRSRRPVTLIYVEEYPTKTECLRREAALKKLTHQQKKALWEAQRVSQEKD